ncbi:unnamed protein product [Spirodela intermedia]|uniref:Ribosomal protein/NADH dehydrogenase domain-containing protein n=1 Tax=Spirodela intermedia TaxID=51605 RepID=A0ABN7ED35_SPIIN|nr:unnamed protein product [Spirodela intermedia]
MLKFLSRVRFEFNALDPRTACCMEFLAQCNAARHKELNPGITITYVNGTEEVVDATSTTAQALRERVIEKGQMLSTEQMFREAGERWPVVIPKKKREADEIPIKIRALISG